MIIPNYPPLADDPTAQAFAVRGLNKIFAGRPVVSNLSLDIPRGSIYGIVGPNGAGKSTLARALKERAEQLGLQVTLTREPGGSPKAEAIREPVTTTSSASPEPP